MTEPLEQAIENFSARGWQVFEKIGDMPIEELARRGPVAHFEPDHRYILLPFGKNLTDPSDIAEQYYRIMKLEGLPLVSAMGNLVDINEFYVDNSGTLLDADMSLKITPVNFEALSLAFPARDIPEDILYCSTLLPAAGGRFKSYSATETLHASQRSMICKIKESINFLEPETFLYQEFDQGVRGQYMFVHKNGAYVITATEEHPKEQGDMTKIWITVEGPDLLLCKKLQDAFTDVLSDAPGYARLRSNTRMDSSVSEQMGRDYVKNIFNVKGINYLGNVM